VQTDRVSGKPILLYPEGTLFLNPTGHAIVQLCTGTATFDDIVATLAARYQIPASQISQEVTAFLHRLVAKNLVELSGAGEHKS
jgi:pyrroloquinoline quinone biosynthesis protein D